LARFSRNFVWNPDRFARVPGHGRNNIEGPSFFLIETMGRGVRDPWKREEERR
jgi:hypothetical protein